MPTAVITGASTGLGRAIATSLAGAGWRVFGSVRKEADAAALEAELGPQVTALRFDVTDAAGIAAGAGQVAREVGAAGIDALVNNAGIAVGGPLQHLPLDAFRHQIEVNVTGLLAVTQAFLPLLGAEAGGGRTRPPGRIVNMSSVAGRSALPFVGPYAVSKFAVEALSDSLRRELLVHGIDVIVLQPGSIVTPIWDKGDAEDYSPYDGTAYEGALKKLKPMAMEIGRGGLPATAVGDAVLRILTAARPKPRYLVARSPMGERLFRMIPTRFLDRAIAKRLGILPKP